MIRVMKVLVLNLVEMTTEHILVYIGSIEDLTTVNNINEHRSGFIIIRA
jgi:hypothetical protein